MFDARSPLYIKPAWDPVLWSWLLQFAKHCTREHVDACMATMGPLGFEAAAHFDDLIEEESLECGYRKEGYYQVCLTQGGLKEARDEAELAEAHGYQPEVVDGEELRNREPALGPAVVGGVHYPESATLDPTLFLHQLWGRSRDLGAELREGVQVTSVSVEGGRVAGVSLLDGAFEPADEVVLATGPLSLSLSRVLGLRLPVQPGKGYHRDIPIGAGGAPALRISCVVHERSVFCTRMGDFVRFAGTMEFSGANHVLRRTRLEQLTRGARLALPGLGDAQPLSEWCGLRPMSSDGLPIVGSIPGATGLHVATGHGMLGLTLGPVTGNLIASEVLSPEAEPRYPQLCPARFDKGGPHR
jgi:D-amino-acid dehydrogenase